MRVRKAVVAVVLVGSLGGGMAGSPAQAIDYVQVTGAILTSTGAPIVGLEVTWSASNAASVDSVTTDESGHFIAEDVPTGTVTFTGVGGTVSDRVWLSWFEQVTEVSTQGQVTITLAAPPDTVASRVRVVFPDRTPVRGASLQPYSSNGSNYSSTRWSMSSFFWRSANAIFSTDSLRLFGQDPASARPNQSGVPPVPLDSTGSVTVHYFGYAEPWYSVLHFKASFTDPRITRWSDVVRAMDEVFITLPFAPRVSAVTSPVLAIEPFKPRTITALAVGTDGLPLSGRTLTITPANATVLLPECSVTEATSDSDGRAMFHVCASATTTWTISAPGVVRSVPVTIKVLAPLITRIVPSVSRLESRFSAGTTAYTMTVKKAVAALTFDIVAGADSSAGPVTVQGSSCELRRAGQSTTCRISAAQGARRISYVVTVSRKA